jgi:ribosomal protein S18 acetylase RimI-like enzyme
VNVAPLDRASVEAVARLHCASLTGLLTRLGEPAARAFYSGCVGTDLAIGFVAVDQSVVRGLVLGSVHPDRLDREVLRRNPLGTLAGLARGIARHPSLLAWLVGGMRGSDEDTYDRRAAELKYLAVAADQRGGGTGRLLVEAFSKAMREAGVEAYELSVDDDNRAAIDFYEKLGFRRVGSYREFGLVRRRYRIELAPST